MAAEIRVDKIKARAGINTLTFSDLGGFSFSPGVGIGTTVVNDPIKTGSEGKLSVGIASVRELYVGLVTSNYGSGYSYINVGTGVSVVGIATFHDTVRIAGITTFATTSHVKLPSGTTGQRPSPAVAGDFRYNTTDGKFEGYTSEWGEIGGGGATQVSGIVSTTSTVGFAASFAVADYRSASVNFLINDATGASQAGKYLMIHDGTTVTVVEQVAVATGSMLGTVSGQIAHSNAELLVTMGSAGVATCSAKLDTMADSA